MTETCWRWLGMAGSYSVQSSIARITRGSHVKSRTLEIKHRVHTIKFYQNWLKFVEDDSVWLAGTLCKVVWLELHVGPHQEPESINKILYSHYKILSKLTEICWRWLSMTKSYYVQSSMTWITRGSHVKSRTLKIKHRVHTLKFYRNWLKFIGDGSVWLAATLCKTVWLKLHVGPTSRAELRNIRE